MKQFFVGAYVIILFLLIGSSYTRDAFSADITQNLTFDDIPVQLSWNGTPYDTTKNIYIPFWQVTYYASRPTDHLVTRYGGVPDVMRFNTRDASGKYVPAGATNISFDAIFTGTPGSSYVEFLDATSRLLLRVANTSPAQKIAYSGEAFQILFSGSRIYVDNMTFTIKDTRTPPTTSLDVINPYRFGLSDTALERFDLARLLPNIADLGQVAATGITLDQTSTAIAIFRTSDGTTPVEFTVGDDLELALFDPAFLTKLPAKGGKRLIVAPAGLIRVGSDWVAAALVQAPQAKRLVGFIADPRTIQAKQGAGPVKTRSLELTRPPVILVHGLWGYEKSLQRIHDVVADTSPWSRRPSLVSSIAYDKKLPFDASTGPKAPANVLDVQIRNNLNSLNSQGIVAGRVDIVAHSMGGLVSRYYATRAGYRSPQNRMAGNIHVLVTLNTPHNGSAWADFLLQPKIRGGRQKRGGFPGFIWQQACKPKQTVEQCFNNKQLEMPIAGPDGRVETGAVYSLRPKGPSLTRLNKLPMMIPNAIQVATASTAPNGSSLRIGLEALIAAITDPKAKTPTADSVLKTTEHDVIVRADSQRFRLPKSAVVTLRGLAHTDFSKLGPIGDNSSIYNDAGVHQLILCWLEGSGDTSCRVPPKGPSVAKGQGTPRSIVPSRALPGMILPLSTELALAKPIELELRLPSSAPVYLELRQSDEEGHLLREALPILRRTGALARVTVVPKLLGQVEFEVTARFEDGGFTYAAASARVGSDRPQALRADAFVDSVHLETQYEPRAYKLRPEATFAATGTDGLAVPLEDQASFRVVTGVDVVNVAPDGSLQALRPGEALVEASFKGVADRIAVHVD